MMKWIFFLLAGFILAVGQLQSIPVIDITVQDHGIIPTLFHGTETATVSKFTLNPLTTLSVKHRKLNPLRMTFSIDSAGIYYRNRQLRNCFRPFSESSMESLPSYGLLRIHEFNPLFFLFPESSKIPPLVSSVSITLALPK